VYPRVSPRTGRMVPRAAPTREADDGNGTGNKQVRLRHVGFKSALSACRHPLRVHGVRSGFA
jgi:hypothetical protein